MHKQKGIGIDALSLTGSKILVNVIMLVSAMLLARMRTLEENGIYFQLMIVITTSSSIAMLGLPNSINYFLAKCRNDQDVRKFLSVFYTAISFVSIVLGIVLVLMMPLWAGYFSNSGLKAFAFFLLIYPWCQAVSSTVENMLIVLGKMRILILYRLANSISVLAVIVIIWALHMSFKTYMLVFLAVSVFYSLLVIFLANKYSGGIKIQFDKQLTLKILKFSIPIGLASMVGTINIELDKLIVGYFFDTEQLAIYTNASKEMPVAIIASSLTAVLMPKMVKLFDENKNIEAVELWKSATTLSLAIMAFLAIGMATFSKEALIFLYSEKYATGYIVFAIYSITLMLKCTYFGIILNTTGHTKIIFYSSVGTLLINVVFNLIFLSIFGMIGPAIATFLSGVAMCLFQLGMSSKIIGIRFALIFPWKACGVYILVNLIMGVMFYLLHRLFFSGVLMAIVLAAIWGVLYVILVRNSLLEEWRKLNV